MAKSLLIVSALFLAVVASVNAAPAPKKREYTDTHFDFFFTFIIIILTVKIVFVFKPFSFHVEMSILPEQIRLQIRIFF